MTEFSEEMVGAQSADGRRGEGRATLISIVIPSYNRAHLITRSIDSVLAQTYANWELIVVNDHSADHTQEVVGRYVQSDPRIRCVSNDAYAHCAGGARNRGLDEVRGEFVAFLDSDDAWPHYHLEELLDCLLVNPDLDWVFGDLRRIRADGRVLVESKFRMECGWLSRFRTEAHGDVHLFGPDQIIENCLRYGIPASVQTSLLRTRVVRHVRMREFPVVEDRVFVLEAVARGFRIGYVDRIHLDYLVHEENISGSNLRPDLGHQLKVSEAMERFWSDYAPSVVPMTRRRRRILRDLLADHLVWSVAYHVCRPAGRKALAARCILRGIGYRPWKLAYWKTLAATLIKPTRGALT